MQALVAARRARLAEDRVGAGAAQGALVVGASAVGLRHEGADQARPGVVGSMSSPPMAPSASVTIESIPCENPLSTTAIVR